jgi:hypothetical protein
MPSVSPYTAHELRCYIAECARRKIEGLRLYEPLPVQLAFHQSRKRVRLLRGGNRSGKTLGAAVEVARAVTGTDPIGKYPQEDGRWYCVGKDLGHVGETMYRKLCLPGAFKMIRDETSGDWRAFRPWYAPDLDRITQVKLSAPLIPQRLIKSIAWESKKENIPSIIKLVNGWEIVFYSSLGKPPQGADIDGWWFDEEIVDEEWYPEMAARILDRHGSGIWSATPQAGTDQLYELHELAERDRGDPAAYVEEFVCLMNENPHMTEEDKKFFASTLSEEQISVRIGGDFAIAAYKVYPEFSMFVHGYDPPGDWRVPLEWTRFAVTDPGYQTCGVLFAAVPLPPDDSIYIYDELYLKNVTAMDYARAMQVKCAGQQFQAFIIDPHAAIATQIGSGKTVGAQYSEELAKLGVRSIGTGSNFAMIVDDVKSGILAVHSLLAQRDNKKPRLRVLAGRCPNLEHEFKRYHNKREAGKVLDKPDPRKHSHLMDTLRYLALYNPRYIKPVAPKPPMSPVIRALKLKKQRAAQKMGQSMSHLGPGSGHDL